MNKSLIIVFVLAMLATTALANENQVPTAKKATDCVKGTHWMTTWSADQFSWDSGCLLNNIYCANYDNAAGSCKRCRFWAGLTEKKTFGDWCFASWWAWLFWVMFLLFILGLLIGLIVAISQCLCGSKKSKQSSNQGNQGNQGRRGEVSSQAARRVEYSGSECSYESDEESNVYRNPYGNQNHY